MNNKEFNGLTCFTENVEITYSSLSNKLGVLILQSDANPDYYARQNFPPSKESGKDRYLYLVAKKQISCFQDIILRYTDQLAKETKEELNIFPGQMSFQNEAHLCVRINSENTEHLPKLIEKLQSLDIQLFNNKSIKPYTSLVFYKKFIEFDQIEEGVYGEKNNKNRFFFVLNKQLEFEELSAGIQNIKSNCDFHLFDTFLSSIYLNSSIIDFIGIYSDHCDKNRFGELKENINKIFNN